MKRLKLTRVHDGSATKYEVQVGRTIFLICSLGLPNYPTWELYRVNWFGSGAVPVRNFKTLRDLRGYLARRQRIEGGAK